MDTEEDEDQFKVGPHHSSGAAVATHSDVTAGHVLRPAPHPAMAPHRGPGLLPRRQGEELYCTELYCTVLYCTKVLVIVSSLFLVTSIIMLILSTVPEFQVCFVIMAAGGQ